MLRVQNRIICYRSGARRHDAGDEERTYHGPRVAVEPLPGGFFTEDTMLPYAVVAFLRAALLGIVAVLAWWLLVDPDAEDAR